MNVMILTKKEKESLVIKLASQGMTTREIAKAAHISLLDIGKIIRRYTGEETDHQSNPQSVTSKAFQMFKENKSRVDVAIALNLESEYVVTLFEDYLCLLNLDKLMNIYKDLGDGIYLLDYLFHHMKYEGIATKNAISRFTEMAGRLTKLDEEELKICEQIGKLNSKKFELEKEIEEAIKELDQYDVSLIEKSQNI
jgi:predicted transcriptional regulator